MPFRPLQARAYFMDYLPVGTGRREYFVDYERDVAIGNKFSHTFCGPHTVPGAMCPNCVKPLLRFFALDTADERLHLGQVPFGVLSLFFCWRCPIAQEMLFYRIVPDSGIELLQYQIGEPEVDWPRKDYPDYFPMASARLVEISDEAQQMFQRLNRGMLKKWPLRQRNPELIFPRHQYGGEPVLMQRDLDYLVECSSCGDSMPFLASIGTDCLDPRGFVKYESVQVIYHYCTRCHVMGVFQQTE